MKNQNSCIIVKYQKSNDRKSKRERYNTSCIQDSFIAHTNTNIMGKAVENPTRIATAGIIRKGTNILIAQRKKDSWLEPNKWEFPGGKLESNETFEECLVREIREELDITISVDRLFLKTTHTYMKNNEAFPVTLMAYLADWKEGSVKHLECQNAVWIDPTDMVTFDFVAADIPIVDKLLSEFPF